MLENVKFLDFAVVCVKITEAIKKTLRTFLFNLPAKVLSHLCFWCDLLLH